MRKQLMTGVAAAAICLGFASCSRYDFTPISEGEQAYANYENAFIKKFGEPAPDQTWGFGSAEANNGAAAQGAATRSAFRPTTRSIGTYTFPDDASQDKFLANVPDGVTMYAEWSQYVSYIDENFNGSEVKLQGKWIDNQTKPNTLYVKGNVDLTSKDFYAAYNAEIYLVEGSTLKLKSNTGLNKTVKVYIAKNAKLVINGDFNMFGVTIYNHGTIEASSIDENNDAYLYNSGILNISGKIKLNSCPLYNATSGNITTSELEANGTGLFYNKGTLTDKGELYIANASSVMINDGDLSATNLKMAGTSTYQNNGNSTFSGNTVIDANNDKWENNGTYTTQDFLYTAGSPDVVNNCKLIVKGEFCINLGDNAGTNGFIMNGGSSCIAGSYKAKGPHNIYMGAGSLFKVDGTATMDATKADYGIYGPTSGGYAVFQAKDIVAGSANQGYEITYGNNLYVVAETHFAQSYSGSYPYIDFKGGCSESNIFTAGNMPNYSIASSECNPGFNNGPTPIRVIAEDLTASEGSDFDFNDVVFDVQLNWPSQGQHKITLQAAGGKLPLRVGVLDDEHEVHYLFGVDTNTMVNTEDWTAHKAPVSFVITPNSEEYKSAKDIKVWVKKGSEWCELMAEQGKAASKIGVPSTFKWVKELKDIEPIYTKFKDYVKDPSVEWWKTISDESQIYNAQ
ncbi:MAG: hypothetical protein ACI4T5_09975 [Prevotella sp.]